MSAIKVQKLYGSGASVGVSPYAQVGDNGELYASTIINYGPFYLSPQSVGYGFNVPSSLTLYNSGTWTIPSTFNAMSVGTIGITTGVTVVISTGARWVIV